MSRPVYSPMAAAGVLGNMPALKRQLGNLEYVARHEGGSLNEQPSARANLWRAAAALRLAAQLFARDPLLFAALCAQIDEDRGAS
jgi:hypothetical protein